MADDGHSAAPGDEQPEPSARETWEALVTSHPGEGYRFGVRDPISGCELQSLTSESEP